MPRFRALCWLGIIGLIGGCARARMPSPVAPAPALYSPMHPESVSPLPPPPMSVTPSTLYPMDANLEAAALRPPDFPFMRALYEIRTEIHDETSRGLELRYPAEEDRFHPFIKGFAVELRLFQDARQAWDRYTQRLAAWGGSYRALSTSADSAYLRMQPSAESPGREIWVHEVTFLRGNLVGYLVVKWSEPLDPRFFQERVDLILKRLGRGG